LWAEGLLVVRGLAGIPVFFAPLSFFQKKAEYYLAGKTPDSCLVMDRPSEGLKPKACSQRNRRLLSAEFHCPYISLCLPGAFSGCEVSAPIPVFFAPLSFF
jgi:hypothetical protein